MATIRGTDCILTLEELERDAVLLAEEMAGRGLGPGDRVLLKADNSVGYALALFGLMHLGASILLLDHRETAAKVARLLRQTRITACLTDDETAMPDDAPSRLSIYELRLAATGRPPGPGLDVTAWAARPDGLLMCSSGSTGAPKIVVKTGGSFLTNLRRNHELVGHVPSDVLLPLLPFSHQYGLSMLVIAWLVRCSLVIAPYRRLDHTLRMAAVCGATVLDATPSSYQSMLNLVRRREDLRPALTRARMLCVGAAPLAAPLVAECRAETGHDLLDSYGSTELGNVAFATLDEPVACGRAVAGVGVRVVDADGAELGPGRVGEVEVLTPDVMCGYLDETGQLDPVTEGWYPTDDIGSLDARGNLTVLGRQHAVNRLGHTLQPAELERRMETVGCRARIVAVPDERTGARLVAFVQDDVADQDADYWRDRLKGVMASYELPNRIVVLDSFPLNNVGKVDQVRLRRLAETA